MALLIRDMELPVGFGQAVTLDIIARVAQVNSSKVTTIILVDLMAGEEFVERRQFEVGPLVFTDDAANPYAQAYAILKSSVPGPVDPNTGENESRPRFSLFADAEDV